MQIQNRCGPVFVMHMTGWRLSSAVGEQTFTFPDGNMLPGQSTVWVHSATSITPGPQDLIWTTAEVWDDASDEARLNDADGYMVGRWAYPKR